MTGSRDNHKNKRYDSLPNRAELKIIQVQYNSIIIHHCKLPAFCHFTHKPILTQPKLIIKSLKTTQASQQCETTTSICKFFLVPSHVSNSTIHHNLHKPKQFQIAKQSITHFDARRISGFFALLGVLTFDEPFAATVFAAVRALVSRLTKLLVAKIACGFKS